MYDDGFERGEAPVVIEATFRVGPESFERTGSIALVRRSLGLEVVDANLLRRMHVPSGLREERRHMTCAAPPGAVEDFVTAARCDRIEKMRGRRRRRKRELSIGGSVKLTSIETMIENAMVQPNGLMNRRA